MKGLEHGDCVSPMRQLAGGGQAGRPRADDGHAPPGRDRVGGIEKRRVAQGPVGHEALEVADGHRSAGLGPQADLFALALLRADPPGDAGQGVVGQ